MKNINHPIGNIKIFIIKKTAEFIKATILNILSLLINIKKNQSEIIISRALFAPWKEDKHFKQFGLISKTFSTFIFQLRNIDNLP